jgi:threonine/homoserine/homoserine lactone efflux protein
MENIFLISTILGFHLFAWLTPGPLFVLIIRNSLLYSRRSGIWTAVGISMGNFIHITYSVTGLSLLVATSEFGFTIIKFLGASYLTYLGIKTFIIKVKEQEGTTPKIKYRNLPALRAMEIGFITNMLSPKAALFYISVFATVMGAEAPFWVIMFLWGAMPFNSFVIANIFSILFTKKTFRGFYTHHQHLTNRFLGSTLILLAIAIVIS